MISKVDYNEIGQVLNKHLHSTDSVNFLQTIAYTYNERGWLLGSSAPLFAMNLYYNTGTNKAYNGNIMYQYWGTAGSLNNHYSYTYDKLNRIGGGSSNTGNNEPNITYDLAGNITFLNRYQGLALTEIDMLNYTYTDLSGNYTNQLQKVVDATSNNSGLASGTTTYTYDGNGNELSAANTVNTAQNKSFTYNLLNLPLVATFATGTSTYIYDVTGNKLRKVNLKSGTTTTTDYISGIEYDNSTTTIGFIQTEEGKAVPNGTSYDYTYYLGDNLSNTRVVFGTKTGSAVSYQTDDYYPFGMEILGGVLSPKNEYLYNKKELQEELTEYDYGARFYDPVIGRWNTIDSKAEVYSTVSPYNYVLNNPISFTDPDGNGPTDPPTFFEKILAFLGISTRSHSNNSEDARTYSERQSIALAQGREQIRQTNAIKEKLDVVPFLGAISRVSSGMVDHDDKEAGLGIGMGLVDAIGGELAGEGAKIVEGEGKGLLENIVKKVGNYADHLKESDMTGAIKDIFGTPVLKDDGSAFQHLKEVTEALGGVKNQLKKLEVGIRRGTFTEDVLGYAKKLRSTLNKQRTRLEKTLARAKKAAGNQ